MGRPKIGRDTKSCRSASKPVCSRRSDAYAKRHGLKRAQLVAQGLRRVIGDSGPSRPRHESTQSAEDTTGAIQSVPRTTQVADFGGGRDWE
jgi:hypothetical protein